MAVRVEVQRWGKGVAGVHTDPPVWGGGEFGRGVSGFCASDQSLGGCVARGFLPRRAGDMDIAGHYRRCCGRSRHCRRARYLGGLRRVRARLMGKDVGFRLVEGLDSGRARHGGLNRRSYRCVPRWPRSPLLAWRAWRYVRGPQKVRGGRGLRAGGHEWVC